MYACCIQKYSRQHAERHARIRRNIHTASDIYYIHAQNARFVHASVCRDVTNTCVLRFVKFRSQNLLENIHTRTRESNIHTIPRIDGNSERILFARTDNIFEIIHENGSCIYLMRKSIAVFFSYDPRPNKLNYAIVSLITSKRSFAYIIVRRLPQSMMWPFRFVPFRLFSVRSCSCLRRTACCEPSAHTSHTRMSTKSTYVASFVRSLYSCATCTACIQTHEAKPYTWTRCTIHWRSSSSMATRRSTHLTC